MAAFPLGSYVKIGAKPVDLATGPGWVSDMDEYTGTIGLVIDADRTEHVNVLCSGDSGGGSQQFAFATGWLTAVAATEVPAELRAHLAAVDALIGRLNVKEFFLTEVSHHSAAMWPAGVLVRTRATGRASPFGIVMFQRGGSAPDDQVAVVHVWPVCSVTSVDMAQLDAVTAVQFAALPLEERTRLTEMHGFVKHKFEFEVLVRTRMVTSGFTSLPLQVEATAWLSPAQAFTVPPTKKRELEPIPMHMQREFD